MLNLIEKPLMKKSISKKAGLLFAMVVAGYVFSPSTAFADSLCQIVPGKKIIVNSHFDFNRDSAQRNDMPLFGNSRFFDFACHAVNKTFYYELRVNNSSPNNDGKYDTGTPGLTIKYGIEPSNECNQDQNNSLKGNCPPRRSNFPATLKPTISLHGNPNTLPTGSANINPELVLYYHFGNEPEKLLGTVLSGNINFTYKRIGCTLETPTLNLPMGQVKSSQFNGLDSEAGSASSQIKLTCDPGTKYSITVNATNEPGHPNLIQLAQKSGAATGVGVKLILNNKHVELGKTQEMGISANAGQNLPENIDINASYYQTQNRVTPGSADASATFTMTYQ